MMSMTFSPAILPASCVALRRESLKYAGTVITALPILPICFSASCRSFFRISADRNSGVISWPSKVRLYSALPMWRFTRSTTCSGSSIAARMRLGPTITWPLSASRIKLGVSISSSSLGSATGLPCSSKWAMAENVVPRSMPTVKPGWNSISDELPRESVERVYCRLREELYVGLTLCLGIPASRWSACKIARAEVNKSRSCRGHNASAAAAVTATPKGPAMNRKCDCGLP